MQPDEDQQDPDERHDPDSDMELDDHKPLEDSARYLFFLLRGVIYFCMIVLSVLVVIVCALPHVIFCYRRSNIQGIRVKREFAETETKYQVLIVSVYTDEWFGPFSFRQSKTLDPPFF